jgi:hypothetical protein
VCNSRAADDGKEALTLAACPNDLAIDEPHATQFLGAEFCRSIATSYNEIPTPIPDPPLDVSPKNIAPSPTDLAATLCNRWLILT